MRYFSGAETFFEREGAADFRFAPKFAKHLHQPAISIRVGSCTL